MTTTPTWTTSFIVPSNTKYGDPSFNLTNPVSNSPGAFTYTSSKTNIATIYGNTVTIVGAGITVITATQDASGIYTSKTATATLVVDGILSPTWATSFVVPSNKKYRDPSFNLTNPVSNSNGVFTYTSSNTMVATVNGNGNGNGNGPTVTILTAGSTVITATQDVSGMYTSKTATATLVVGVIPSLLSNFIIPKKEFNDISFNLTDPSSNNVGLFTFVSSNPSVATISGRVVTIHAVGTSTITASPTAYWNFSSGGISTELTVFTSIVRTGVQNQLDLSWNRPTNNGATIKNYFFYSEEREMPSVTSPVVSFSYDSYLLPVPYSTPFLSSSGFPTGFDINQVNQVVTLSPAITNTTTNYFDMSYNAEVELSWAYHSDRPIENLFANSVSQTTMTLSLYKRNTVTNTRVDMLRSYERTYDSFTNGLGAIPENNGKIMKDVFNITFDTGISGELLYFKKDDVLEGTIKYSDFYYYPASAAAITDEYRQFYSIIVLGARVFPYRTPITQDFSGVVVSNLGAGAGTLYYLRKLTRPLTSFNEAKMSLSWNYSVDVSGALAQSPALLPSPISNFNAPFQLRVRCYSRAFKKVYSAMDDASYNPPSAAGFLSTVSDPSYNTYLLFDISRNFTASYNNVVVDPSTNTLPVISTTFDVPGVASFPASAPTGDPAHTQIVYILSLVITDTSYNAAFQSTVRPFKVNIVTHTFTPRQIYRFSGPDPTTSSSSLLTSPTKTIYNIDTPYYQDITPFYRFYNLTNGHYYSYKIASNNLVGTSAFSQLLTRRCGSIPNQIVNIPGTPKYYFSESERLSNKISVLWYKPDFSGYEILNFIIQINVDISGRWLNNLEYTPDLSLNTVTFTSFDDVIIPASAYESAAEPNKYRYNIERVSYRTLALAQAYTAQTGIPAEQYGSLINGNKYYLRITSQNELGLAKYSSVLTGIPITRPENAPARLIGSRVVVGDNLVYLTWKIPPDDGGAPILNYIIDYQEFIETPDSSGNIKITLVGTKYRYNQNAEEPTTQIKPSYPKDDFVAVYNVLKNRYTMTAAELSVVDASKNNLSKYIIPPSPITLFDADIKNSTAKDASNNIIIDASKNVALRYNNRSFTYYGNELTQNVFDISNIQLKWYYFQDSSGSTWDNFTTVTFTMSVRGHLKHISDASLNIDNIFYIPDTLKTYTVTKAKLSTLGAYQYVNYINDSIITNVNNAPKILIPTLPRIDSYKESKRYKLNLEFTITSFSSSEYKFILHSAPIIINGSAPIRTDATLNTTFTMKLVQNVLSPLDNAKKYRFTIIPFNIADYFPTYDANTTDVTMGILTSDPIRIPTYLLVQEANGGKVVLRWYYGSRASYYITISIPTNYLDADYPNEYPSEEQNDGTIRSILTTNLTPAVDKIVTYSIPSVEPDDISVGNAQRYLRPGRAYIITVAPIKTAEVNGSNINLVAPFVPITSSMTYIVPFMAPLRPTSIFAVGYNGRVSLSWKLPNPLNDPNYYVSDMASPYYTYRYYSLEMRDVSGGGGGGGAPVNWITVSDRIAIPAGASEGYTVTRDVSAGIINEHNYQFRIRLLIQNDYNAQFAFSDYTYLSNVNNIAVPESANNVIYPSQYPYKPFAVTSLYALRPSPRSLYVEFNQPSYTGNATYYECFIEYSNDNSVTWSGIFDTSGGIADTSDNTIILTPDNNKLTVNASVGAISSFTITCKSIVLSYTIRVRLLGKIAGVAEPYNFPSLSYTDYSDIVKISI